MKAGDAYEPVQIAMIRSERPAVADFVVRNTYAAYHNANTWLACEVAGFSYPSWFLVDAPHQQWERS